MFALPRVYLEVKESGRESLLLLSEAVVVERVVVVEAEEEVVEVEGGVDEVAVGDERMQ